MQTRAMPKTNFPDKIRSLEPFSDRFDAFRLPAQDCDVLFATYPAGTEIEPHRHDTDNWGVITKGEIFITVDGTETSYRAGDWYTVAAGVEHAARCAEDTEEIEFWFKKK
jgi:quercetin dioxygenase-like cupin family protein